MLPIISKISIEMRIKTPDPMKLPSQHHDDKDRNIVTFHDSSMKSWVISGIRV